MILVPRNYVSQTYNELPEHYVLGIHPNHTSANQSLLYTKFCHTNLVKHGRVMGKSVSQTSALYHFMSLVLLSCGDVHPCQGPNYKYPCGVCKKPVKSNQKGILCDLCNLWHHTKCINMPNETYFKLANDEEEPWECPNCSFPYDFSNSFFNTTMNDEPVNDDPGNESNMSQESVSDKDIYQEFYAQRTKYVGHFL